MAEKKFSPNGLPGARYRCGAVRYLVPSGMVLPNVRHFLNSNFYRVFEDHHRGSRALIKSRLRAYLPFVESLKNVQSDVNALDLGCGRGEWLELMQEVGIDCHGVDLDEGMLLACRELGLQV